MIKVTFVKVLVFLKDKLLAIKAFQLLKVNKPEIDNRSKIGF